MATLPLDRFRYEGCTNSDVDYDDHEFTDTGRNGIRRYWRIWRDKQAGTWHGHLLRSATDDGEFNREVSLPDATTRQLVAMIPVSV